MSAKTEIGDYAVSTRFSGYKKQQRDLPIARPKTRREAISQVEELYQFNRWNERDRRVNAEMCGLEYKPLAGCSNDELKIILTEAEKTGMIIYE